MNGDDAQVVTGPDVAKGQAVTWTYDITNTGNTFLSNVTLTDVVTISGESDPAPVCNWAASSDPTTVPGLLSRGETVTCTASGVAITGQYGNDADVVGTTVLDDGVTPVVKVDTVGNPIPATVTDDDPAHYFGVEYDLALAKVADVTSVNQGGTVVWTIRVVNQGNVDSGEYTVTDVVPDGLTVTGTTSTVTPVSATSVDRTYTWVLPSLAPGANADIEITTTVADINQRPFRNWAEISADSSATYSTTDFDSTPNLVVGDDDGPGSGTDPDDDVVDNPSLVAIPDTVVGDEDDNDLAEVTGTVLYDLALVKTVDTPVVPADGLATWTITVKNQGDVDSRAYEITDNLPAGLTVETATPPPTTTLDRTSTWIMPNLAPGDTATVTIVTRVVDQAVKPFVNWAEISADGSSFYTTVAGTVNDADSTPDTNIGDDPGVGLGTGPTDGSGNPETNVDRLNDSDVDTDLGLATDEDDSDQAVLNSNVLYDLALVKTVDSALVLPGDTITWTIEVLNQGNVISGEYTVTDVVPNGLAVTGTSASVTMVSETIVDRTHTFVMPSLDPGDAASITITTTISDINMRSYRNWAEISDDSADELFGTVDSDSTPDTNTGDDDAGFDDVGADPNDVVVDQTVLPTVQFNDPTIDEDDNDLAEVAVDIATLYDLALVKTVDDSGIDAGNLSTGTATFSIAVQNQGNVPSGDFTITDQVPAGLAPSAISDAGTYDAGTRTIVWTVDQLLPTVTTIVTYDVSIVDVSAQPFRNIAEISADSAADYAATDVDSTPDAIVDNDGVYPPLLSAPGTGIDNLVITEAGNDGIDDEDDADVADLVVPVVYDLALAKTVDSPTVEPDGTVTFEVVVENQGNVESNEFTVTDFLPDGLALDPPFTGTYDAVDHTLIWTVAQLAPGESESFTFQMSVSDTTRRPYRNTAEISADSADDYDAGGIDDLALIDVEDADSTPDADSANDGDYGPVGDSSEVDNVGPDAIDRAGVGADAPPGGEDDADIADVTLEVRYDLALVKILPAGQDYSSGSAINYQIDVMNQGNVDSREFSFVDVIPAGMSFVSASDGGDHNARIVTWTVTNLAPGEVRRVSVSLRLVDVTLAAYDNYAEITQDSADDYSSPGDPVTDADSTPDGDITNDRVAPTDDVTIDLGSTDEDDHDVEPIDIGAVLAANQPPPPNLPATGATIVLTLSLATLLFLAGWALFGSVRRRRGQVIAE